MNSDVPAFILGQTLYDTTDELKKTKADKDQVTLEVQEVSFLTDIVPPHVM